MRSAVAFAELDERLDKFRITGPGKATSCCPGHEDRSPSLSIALAESGKVLLHCFAGCDLRTILDGAGLKESDLFPDDGTGGRAVRAEPRTPVARPAVPKAKARKEPLPFDIYRPSARYIYTAEDGAPLYAKWRYLLPDGDKAFLFWRPDGHGGWTIGRGGIPLVLYHLPHVLNAVEDGRLIYIVEGEKDADSLMAQAKGLPIESPRAFVATTGAEGANRNKPAWEPSYTMALAGAASVVVVADRDPTGRVHANNIARNLYGHVRELRLLEPRA